MSSPQFYEVMKYPVPIKQDFYWYITEQDKKSHNQPQISWKFSWIQKWDLMKSYSEFINTHLHFLESIPFISQIYLCNSITFNALHPWSDIDLCIVTKPWYLWYARFWSRWFFTFLNLKRVAWFGDHSYKFCLSFYIDGENTNLISLRKEDGDIYLSYWIAHTVLLYTNSDYDDDYLLSQNQQLLSYLPYHPLTQSIFLDTIVMRRETLFKKTIEIISSSRLGQQLQFLIKYIRWNIINTYKTNRLSPHSKEYIIVSPTMLKFYTDKRTLYQQKRKMASRVNKTNDNHNIAHK